MVGLRGERRKGVGRKAKDKSEITPHKGSKGSIYIPLPVSHSNRHHYRDWMMKVAVDIPARIQIFHSLLYHFQFVSQRVTFIY